MSFKVIIDFKTHDPESMSLTFGKDYPDSLEILDSFWVINIDDYKGKLDIIGDKKRRLITIKNFKTRKEAEKFIKQNGIEIEGIKVSIRKSWGELKLSKKVKVVLKRAVYGWGNLNLDMFKREYNIKKIGADDVSSSAVGTLAEISKLLEDHGYEFVDFEIHDKGKVVLMRNINVRS